MIATKRRVIGVLTGSGCAYMETVVNRPSTPDGRVQLTWEDGTLFLARKDILGYTCTNGLLFTCNRAGTRFACRCETN